MMWPPFGSGITLGWKHQVLLKAGIQKNPEQLFSFVHCSWPSPSLITLTWPPVRIAVCIPEARLNKVLLCNILLRVTHILLPVYFWESRLPDSNANYIFHCQEEFLATQVWCLGLEVGSLSQLNIFLQESVNSGAKTVSPAVSSSREKSTKATQKRYS